MAHALPGRVGSDDSSGDGKGNEPGGTKATPKRKAKAKGKGKPKKPPVDDDHEPLLDRDDSGEGDDDEGSKDDEANELGSTGSKAPRKRPATSSVTKRPAQKARKHAEDSNCKTCYFKKYPAMITICVCLVTIAGMGAGCDNCISAASHIYK